MTDEEAVLEVVRKRLELRRIPVSPDTRINGFDAVDCEDAEELIYDAFRSVGLPLEAAAERFPYGTYFYPEINPAIGVPLMLARLIGLRKPMQRLLGLPEDLDSEKPPLTVREFVSLILRIKAELVPGPASPGG